MPAVMMRAVDPCEVSPADWPVRRSDLAALKDLGLSDGQVARYFGVREDDVMMLRACYGIAERSGTARFGPPKRRRFVWRRRG